MENFLKNIYGILFEPKNTINNLIETRPVSQALFIVVALSISACMLTYNFIFGGVLDIIFLMGNVIFVIVSSLIFWLVLAGFFEMTSRIFNDDKHYKQLLALMGFSLLPWIFTAPIELLKANYILTILGNILEIGIWSWSISLIFISIKTLYGLTNKKTCIFLLTPFLGSIIAINWVSQFFAIVLNIF